MLKPLIAIATAAAAFGLAPAAYADDVTSGLWDASGSQPQAVTDEARKRQTEYDEFREQIYRDMLHE